MSIKTIEVLTKMICHACQCEIVQCQRFEINKSETNYGSQEKTIFV